MARHLLILDATNERYWLETLDARTAQYTAPGVYGAREDYGPLYGETVCQYLLRQAPDGLSIARGPLPFLAGNKATIGYLSPLTGAPHYSFVGGRTAAQLFYLGLDAVLLTGPHHKVSDRRPPLVVIEGRAPNLHVSFLPADLPADELPRGQRSAFYWLVERHLDGEPDAGSVLTLGQAAYLGHQAANLAAEAIYHAGRGGCGTVFARFVSALVLRGEPLPLGEAFPALGGETAPPRWQPNQEIVPLLDRYCDRFLAADGGTIPKLEATGGGPEPTLPSVNARSLGYPAADLGSSKVLQATRQGRTGCHWCPIDCRFYHWVEADYAPDGEDRFLDDFEPAYAMLAMLDLQPADESLASLVAFRQEVDRRLMQPIEQLGLDVIDVGVALAALLEGIEAGLIPPEDLPTELQTAKLGDFEAVARTLEWLQRSVDRETDENALRRLIASGPQALARAYPALQERVFTGGVRTLGNAGHSNALWTFLMPFSRFFGHYVGQIYKIDEDLPPAGAAAEAYRACFRRVINRMLQREFFWILCNAFSMCAFVFVIFSQDGEGERLSDDQRFVRLLHQYGIETTQADLEWFAQAFWAQSMALKQDYGWRPPTADEFPERIYEALSLALGRAPGELRSLMDLLIDEWRRQAGETMTRFGYEVPWQH